MIAPLASSTIVNVFSVVAIITTILLGGSWVIGLFLSRHAPLRHMVAVSALLASLATPFLVVLFFLSGLSLQTDAPAPWESSHAEPHRSWAAECNTPAQDRAGYFQGGVTAASTTDRSPVAEGLMDESETSRASAVDEGSPVVVVGIQSLIRALIPFWLIGTVLLLGRLLLGMRQLRARLRTLKPVNDPKLLDAFHEAKRLSRAKCAPRLASSSLVAAPAAAGIFQLAIVLPERLLWVMNRGQWIDLFLHEIAHIERRDNAVALIQAISTVVFWPIPFLHLVNAQLEQAREDICDNFVLSCRDALSYGETLLCVAQWTRRDAKLLGTVGMFHWRGKLEKRILGLLQQGRNKMTRIHPVVAAGILVLFFLASLSLCTSAPARAMLEAPTEPAAIPANEPVAEPLQEPMPQPSSSHQGSDSPASSQDRPLKLFPFAEQGQLHPDAMRKALIAAIESKKGRFVLDEAGQPKQLDWDNPQVTDRDLRLLKPLVKLESLNLSRTQVTSAGLEELKSLTALTDLHLYDTAISDAGLKSLRGLTKLRFLMLKRTDVSDAGARELLKSLPGCLISHSPRNPWPQEIGPDAGRWTVEFTNGVKEECKISAKQATASVAEPKRSSEAKVARLGRGLVFVYDDHRVERWTPVGNRYIVEHWASHDEARPGEISWRGYPPLRPVPTTTPVLGIAERENSPQGNAKDIEGTNSLWFGFLR